MTEAPPRQRVMLVFGTRPEAIKLAPVVIQLSSAPDLEPVVAVTGQHRSMLDQVLRDFQIWPDHDLNVIRPRQTLPGLTQRLLTRLDALLQEAKPAAVVVQGDTTTTLAAALTAFYHRIPVVHVEAGMRTWDMGQPYPEEMNRVVTSRLTALHLAATSQARANLLKEGIPPEAVIVTGNTVIDALHWTLAHHKATAPVVAEIQQSPRPLLLVTAHRRESWGKPMRQIAEAVADIASAHPELQVLFPVHRNPAVGEIVRPVLSGLHNVKLTAPLDYPDFAIMMQKAKLVLTDSGGVQEEAPSLGTPVLVMRDKTERPEAVLAGGARLVGTDRGTIRDSVSWLLSDSRAYAVMAKSRSPYGDGQAAARVVGALRHLLCDGPRPSEFVAKGQRAKAR
ncbi:MAG TPA: UDP-N-acetylglucosamine 2-epimerase (non-hydrolyzing), partial [Acidimicrobiales bacterium]|nr:UDP-N-acetylglucosamine 2-epimerase (non-hydrolyzing) [Acidimicrobiales bacterium]